MSDPTEPKSLPDDVLGRLKACADAVDPTDTKGDFVANISVRTLRDAVAEIERRRVIEAGLRDSLCRALELVRIAREATESQSEVPKPERWEVHCTAVSAVKHIAHGWKPFTTNNGLIWFRRRVWG